MIPEAPISTAVDAGKAASGRWRLRLSAGLLVLLLLSITLGPWLWPQDPSVQWLSSVNQGPSGSHLAQWVDHSQEPVWQQAGLKPSDSISVVEANTERVALQWAPVNAAVFYRISRRPLLDSTDNSVRVSGWMSLNTVSVPRFIDRLQLSNEALEYRVQALSTDFDVLSELRVELRPELAISLFEARLNGLLGLEQTPAPGQRLRLPAHPLGTDALGRDMLARLLQGGQSSLLVGITAPLLCMIFGAFWGGVAALSGGRVDDWMMRTADFVIALPFLLFMILFRIAMGVGPGESGLLPMIIAMVLLSWPGPARLVRGQVLSLKTQPFVEAAQLSGASRFWLLRVHLLPNVLPLILVALSFAIPQAIFTEAFLSFIGMGVVAPTASWGSLCNEGVKTMLTEPAQLLWPALMISFTVLAFNLLGDSLRDRMGLSDRE